MGAHLPRPDLSVVVPIFNEEVILPELYRRLSTVLGEIVNSYEIVFVSDGSRDGSLHILRLFSEQDRRVKVISLSRNFGHQIAITAGLDHARGEAVVIMDGDLQDPPEVIPALLDKWREGFDVVYAVRGERVGESWFKRTTAKVFYRFFARMTNLDVPLDAGDFRLLSRRAAEHLNGIREANRYIRGLTSWLGLRQVGVTFTRDPRFAGHTKYGLRKLMRLGLDGITSFSFTPLQLSTYAGLLIAALCFVLLVGTIYAKLVNQVNVPGWASTIVVILFLFAIQFIILGVYGEYIGRVYAEVKRRPLYIVDEHLNASEAPAQRTEEREPPRVAFRDG